MSKPCPGWCGSVHWVWSLNPKGRQLDSWSRHVPELQARTPAGNRQMFLSHFNVFPHLSSSLPLSLKLNKIFFKKKMSKTQCYLLLSSLLKAVLKPKVWGVAHSTQKCKQPGLRGSGMC